MTRIEDQQLAENQFQGLNKKFYQGAPHEYINRRMGSLLLSTADSAKVRDALAEGVQLGSIKFRSSEPHDQREAENYATLESTVLLHHASEALIRLYLAHRDLPPCPWLEVARLRNFATFKSRLKDLADTLHQDTERDHIFRAFRGSSDPEKCGFKASSDDIASDRRGLVALIQHVCLRLLDESNLYNAAKHGLAVSGGTVGFQLGLNLTEGATISHSGPSLTYLEVTSPETDIGARKWSQTLRWVRISTNIGLVHLIASQIESLWNLARARYTGVNEIVVHPVLTAMLDVVLKSEMQDDINMQGMSIPLSYYAPMDSTERSQ